MENKEEAILVIARGKILQDYFQGVINKFSKKYKVLVIDDRGIEYTGDFERIDIDFHAPIPLNEQLWKDIKKIEKDIDLNLYQSYSDYFYYGRLAQEANISYRNYWKTKEMIGSSYLNAYNGLISLINNYNIKFALYDSIDQIHSKVLEALSKRYEFGFYHTWIQPNIFDNRIILGYGISRKTELFSQELRNFKMDSINEEERAFLTEIFERFKDNQPKHTLLKAVSQKIFTVKELKKIFSRVKNIPFAVKRVINRLWLTSVTKDFKLEECDDYILFFMHHQPEATTTSAAQKYVDQWKIVEDLAVNAPADINIVIKAHPFSFGWQGKSYYNKLLRLPNVYMAPITFSGKELIKQAKAVLTINGSVGLEAMLYDTPAYTLGDAWYASPGYIENLDCHLDIFDRLDNVKYFTHEEKEKVLVSAYRASVDFFISYEEGNTEKKITSGENLAEHILEHKDIYFNRLDVKKETYE